VLQLICNDVVLDHMQYFLSVRDAHMRRTELCGQTAKHPDTGA
jgi:hypothetical protein